MNKIIFQLGLLAFCVAAVAFGIQGIEVMEAVARSFIVFMIVVCGVTLLVFAGSLFRPAPGKQGRGAGPEGGGAAREQEPTSRAAG